MVDSQEEHFDRLGLPFNGLRGRRLQLIDCQNLFCEVDKYARVAHPDVRGISGRARVEQKYVPDPSPLTAWFPEVEAERGVPADRPLGRAHPLVLLDRVRRERSRV